ncbi:MAG: hypothetical protein R6U96_04745 [Promethearchaeia archaeon]
MKNIWFFIFIIYIVIIIIRCIYVYYTGTRERYEAKKEAIAIGKAKTLKLVKDKTE